MGGHPYVNQVEDGPIKAALLKAFDLIGSLTSQLSTAQTTITKITQIVPVPVGPIPPVPPVPPPVGPTFGALNPGDILVCDSAGHVTGLPDVGPGSAVLSTAPGALPHYGLVTGGGLTQAQVLKLVSLRG